MGAFCSSEAKDDLQLALKHRPASTSTHSQLPAYSPAKKAADPYNASVEDISIATSTDRILGVSGNSSYAAPPLHLPSNDIWANLKEEDVMFNIHETSGKAKCNKPASRLRTDAKVKEVYQLGKTLGTGGFSVVKLAVDKLTGTEYACKMMNLPPPGQTVSEQEISREDILKEIDILCSLNHENVIYLKEYFEEEDKVFLITELLTGGELLDAVLARGSYSEGEARMCFVQLLRGIEYLHSKGVVHRDLKLENLLLKAPQDISHVKIADFGLAKKTAGNNVGLRTICGTPQYVAPEVILGVTGHAYGPGVDMWSAGVVLFILLGGYPPFWSESEPHLFDLIRKARFTFNDPVWVGVSQEAKDLICRLLVADPRKRLTATQALQHPWVTLGREGHQHHEPLVGAQANMRKHFPRRKFKAVVTGIIATNRMNNAINAVRNGSAKPGQLTCDKELHQSMQAAAKNFEDGELGKALSLQRHAAADVAGGSSRGSAANQRELPGASE